MSSIMDDLLRPFPRASLGHFPTPLEFLPNLSFKLGDIKLYIKRDDCSGLAFGGNKARQLEFYFGEALQQKADTVLITGAVQSNYVRMTAAAASHLGMQCGIQLEQRVETSDDKYHRSGNVLLDRLLGAELYHYPVGEDETGADTRLDEIAHDLKTKGSQPYVIHLGTEHPPLGALGYVLAAEELQTQFDNAFGNFDHIVIASGSSYSHSGLLLGLRVIGNQTPVSGICVRRNKTSQVERVTNCVEKLEGLLGKEAQVTPEDIFLNDDCLAPGYGCMNDAVMEAITLTAQTEGILLDPVYTGKAMAGLIALHRSGHFAKGEKVLFVHTGGTPGLFAYENELNDRLNAWVEDDHSSS